QTVKELVDNAIDACRTRSSEQDAPTVRVVLRRPKGATAAATATPEAGKDSTINSSRFQEEGPLELQVADNGAGLTDVTKALVLFSSTKSGHESRLVHDASAERGEKGTTAGKYGLGLTLSLLYSQKHFGGFLKVTTATADSRQWSFTKCDIDVGTGLPRQVHRKSGPKPASWSQGCGTDMRLLVPGGEDALRFAAPRLRTFLSRMHLLPDRAAGVSFVCEGCLNDMNIWIPRGGREASPYLLLDNNDLVRAFAKVGGRKTPENDDLEKPGPPSEPFGTTLQMRHGVYHVDLFQPDLEQPKGFTQRQQQHGCRSGEGSPRQDEEQRRGESGARAGHGQRAEGPPSLPSFSSPSDRGCRFLDEDVAVFECEARTNDAATLVTVGVAVERMPPVPDPGRSHSLAHEPPRDHDATVPLLLHRSANGVPMLDTNTSAACALVAGVAAKGSWRSLGLRVSSSPSRLRGGDGRLRFVLSEAPTPLKVVRGGAEWSALSGIKAVHVSVTVKSENVPYTSLRKDAIAHKEGYLSATESAVRQSLLSLAARASGGFCSAAEAAKEMMHEDLIPLVASSVASMVSRTADVNFQKNCLQVLGVGNEYVQEQRLSDLLRCELQESVRRQEARRYVA
ncbi:unnamed protein product, partial [Scytosiphon promiscuus]